MLKQTLGTTEEFRDILLIIVVSIATLAMLVANPGYFSHDELQKLDHVTRFGLKDYLMQYVTLHQGEDFGTPIRPFSFFVQGILALFMENYPVLVHLFDVLTHATVACLLYVLAIQFGCTRSLARTIAIVFVINPMAVLATGWSAALMDRWYVLFGLLALISADRFVRGGKDFATLFFVLIWATLAMLSKETALALPGLMIVVWIADPGTIKSRRFWVTAAVWCTPVLLFMLYRLPALISSFGNPQVSAYKASISNVPNSILAYLSYPFLPLLTEGMNWIFVPMSWIYIAAATHIVLVLSIGRIYGRKWAIYYSVLYSLFIIPVMMISIKSAHYLYGSSLVLSVAVATLLHQSWSTRPIYKGIGVAMILLLTFHSIVLQRFVYTLGTCMNRAMISTEAAYLSNGRPRAVDFQAEPGALVHVLNRINTGREQIGMWFPVKLTVTPWGQDPPENNLLLVMNEQCLVHTKQSISTDGVDAVSYFAMIIHKSARVESGHTQHDISYLRDALTTDNQGHFASELGSGYINYEGSIARQYILLSGVAPANCSRLIKELHADVDIRAGEFGKEIKSLPEVSDMKALCKSGNIWFVL